MICIRLVFFWILNIRPSGYLHGCSFELSVLITYSSNCPVHVAFQGAASFVTTLEKPETLCYVWAGFITCYATLCCVPRTVLICTGQIWIFAKRTKLAFQRWNLCTIYYFYIITGGTAASGLHKSWWKYRIVHIARVWISAGPQSFSESACMWSMLIF